MITPKLPGTDINDPKVLAGAKRVATRRNNDARRKLAKERAALPLFASEIPSEPARLVMAEEVIERRMLGQQGAWENGVERDVREVENIRRYRNEVFALVSEDEYTELYAASLEYRFPQWAYWVNVRDDILRRHEPMSPICELVLTWLVDWEGEPPTVGDLHHLRGDGLGKKEISEAIDWLERRRYVRGGVIRPCRFVENLWVKYSTPFEATDAGRSYLHHS
jgi:GNAT superfamily N-acetyltransferase